MNHALRLQNLRRRLPRLKCDGLVVSHLTNLRYLTGFTGTAGMLLVTRKTSHFITDFRYRSQAQNQVGEFTQVTIAEGGLWMEAVRIAERDSLSRIAFEAEHISVATGEDIQHLLDEKTTTVATRRAVEELRLIKDDDEIAVMREAVRIADETFAEVLELLRPGLSEREVAAAIESGMRNRGATGLSFDTIVASGGRSALPHGVASEKILEHGDLVTIDMGARYRGYCSDMTRTVCLGRANDEQKKIYSTTYRAQVAACEALKPGLGCKAADAIARKIIDGAGYKGAFGHGLGHGVGVDIHEAPRLARLGQGRLASGMVVTCEPGIYLPEIGGVRIEDMLLITADGAEILTGTPKPESLLEL